MFGDFMGNYRSRLDIIADVLKAASDGAKKTWIMYKSNLSYELLTKYLEEIVAAELIVFEANTQKYVITSKGREFLRKYKEYWRHSKRLERQLQEVENRKKALEGAYLNKGLRNYPSSEPKNDVAEAEK